ncbi:proton-conducting transporter transmembrane domain-containing protein [Pseudonocardia abyssalis]|uniref:NADH-quinone oxidoreductase subunit L n=1 Tax=Pseudonocardia abyssalis TaxID=2792008 RepID=A0ABS6URN8_9PSEU|nr:proton-conducting transporter membrane subunit [Pseudonocardia abyssalis]MBW0113844.1 NADH-quinone oxidoreductase subunit L [Pseudonocardia abyssalis]MBW0134914.1 NADH-quinone oxidoreductase subunit L [Pseudonocardia abyssalis]
MELALSGLVAVPVLAGVVLLAVGRPAGRVAAPVAIGVASVGLVLAVLVAVGRPAALAPLLAGIDLGLAVDGLSAVMVLVVSAVALAVVVFAAAEVDAAHRFFGLLLVFISAMLLTVTATNLVTLLAAWEVMGAMSYALVAHRWSEGRPATSGAVAFLVTRTADVGLYVAAGAALAGGIGILALADLPRATGGWRDLLTAGLVVAALGKSAQLPFSFWLARAMDGPSPVSALLHSATMVAAGGYLLLRIEPLLAGSGWAGPLVAWVGAVTVVLLGLVALAQTDLKQLLAASTCSQIGFIVLAAGVGATAGGTLQLVAHAATKSLLFLVAGAWLTALGTKQLATLRGAAARWPLVGAVFAVGALSLAGLPPLSIFFGKDAVLAAAAATSPALYVVGLVGVLVSAAYAAAALVAVLGRAPADAGNDREQSATGEVPLLARLPLVPLALGAAVLGAAAEPVRAALGAAGEPAPTLVEALVSGVLAAAVVLAVLLSVRAGLRGAAVLPATPPIIAAAARVGLLHGWLGLERMAVAGAATPVMALARALSRFDERVVDGAVRAAAGGTRAAARLADLRLEGPLSRGVDGLGAVGRALGRLARRPQTGQLHQYYAQAAGALAVLALFLILVR